MGRFEIIAALLLAVLLFIVLKVIGLVVKFALIAAVLLMRSASILGSDRLGATKYASRATRRSNALRTEADSAMLEKPETPDMSERMIWDALDEGRDPTDRPRESDTEGR